MCSTNLVKKNTGKCSLFAETVLRIAEFVGWCIMTLVDCNLIKARKDWRDVERSHIAMRRNCHLL